MVQQRVLALRVTYDEMDTMSKFFALVFALEYQYDKGFLSRYAFVPSRPIRDCTKSHLISILQRQKVFHKHIQYFVVHGLQNIEDPQSIQTCHEQPNPTDLNTQEDTMAQEE